MPYVAVSAARGNMGHMRNALQLQDGPAHARMPRLVPRALVVPTVTESSGQAAASGVGAGQQAAQAGEEAPKSNKEFRKMLLEGQ